jgi:hypothetical protein
MGGLWTQNWGGLKIGTVLRIRSKGKLRLSFKVRD